MYSWADDAPELQIVTNNEIAIAKVSSPEPAGP